MGARSSVESLHYQISHYRYLSSLDVSRNAVVVFGLHRRQPDLMFGDRRFAASQYSVPSLLDRMMWTVEQ